MAPYLLQRRKGKFPWLLYNKVTGVRLPGDFSVNLTSWWIVTRGRG
jgi:hypothetical protein